MTTYASAAIQILANVLDTQPDSLDQSSSFVRYGGDSIAALRFCTACKLHGLNVAADDVLSSSTIAELLQLCRPEALNPELLGAMDTERQEAEADNSAEPKSPTGLESDSGDSFSDSITHPSGSPVSSAASATNVEDTIRIDNKAYLELQGGPRSGRGVRKCQAGDNDGLHLATLETEDLCEPTIAAKCSPCEFSTTQMSIVQGGIKVPGSNIIHYYEEYQPSRIPAAKNAWRHVLSVEPVFRTVYRDPHTGCNMLPRMHWREFTTMSARNYDDTTSISVDSRKLGAALPSWGEPLSDAATDMAVRFTVIYLEQATMDVPTRIRSTIVWSIHHALIDGWSASLVLRKVRMIIAGSKVQPGPSYSDLCLALDQLRSARKAEGDAFWAERRGKLLDGRDELLLPAPDTGATPAGEPSEPGEVRFHLGHYYTHLREAARSCGVTYAALLHVAWAICLGLYTDSDNIIIGTVLSGRNLPLPGVLDTVGPTINTLPLQVDIDWDKSVAEFSRDVYQQMQLLAQFSWTTLDNGCPLVANHMFAIQPKVQQQSRSCDLGPSFTRQTSDLPLSIVASEDGSFTMQYCSTRYNPRDIKTLSRVFQRSLVAICQTEKTLQGLAAALMSTRSLGLLRSLGNCNSSSTTRSSIRDDLVTLFERAATTHRCAVSTELGNQTITYAELLNSSGRVAQALLDLQVKPEEVVTVHADGSINWIISIYAILRAGAVYCPLDKAHPQDYRDSLFDSSGARFFLATSHDGISYTPKSAVSAVDVDSLLSSNPDLAEQTVSDTIQEFPIRGRARPWEKAYLIFTSGSTGRPKGVMCTHQGLVAFQSDFDVRLRAKAGTRVAQVMSVAFDGSIHEVFSALSYGATLVLRSEGETFGHLKTVDSAILTPSVASVLDPADFPRLKTLYLVGEPVPQIVCETWGAQKTVYNMYGPTEATCGATIKLLSPGKPVTIGRPNPSTRIYILDHCQRLAPPGRVGEIYLAGVQVAQGYLGRAELTEECFLPDPFCSGLGEFMYKTGDRGYWNRDGEISFLGRADREIKLRGYRINLTSLESQLIQACKTLGATAAAVACYEGELVCMVQTDTNHAPSPVPDQALRDAISNAIPAFAVPRYIFAATQLPTTATGKVDYQVVAQMPLCRVQGDRSDEIVQDDRIIMTETEAMVLHIWKDVLGSNNTDTLDIGPDSHFIQLGGHSMHHVRVASKLSAATCKPVNLRMILDLPVLRDLAIKIDEMDTAPRLPVHGNLQDSMIGDASWARLSEPSPTEQEWWHRYRLGRQGTSAFTVSYVGKFDVRDVDRRRLVDSWNTVLARHEVFRSRYLPSSHSEQRVQRIVLSSAYSPRVIEVTRVDARDEMNRPFELFDEPVRVFISNDAVVALWSHIICDYTALGLILEDVASAYNNRPLAPTVSLDDQTQNTAVVPSGFTHSNLAYWSDCLEHVKNDRPAYLGISSKRISYRGKSLAARVSPSLWHRIQAQTSLEDMTLPQLMLAGVAAAVSTQDQLTEGGITLGVPFINRHTETDMRAVGLMLEPLAVRVPFLNDEAGCTNSPENQPRPHTSLRSYLSAVQAACRNSLYHSIPWHQLLEHLGINPIEQLPDHPLFDCVVSFHDARLKNDTTPTTRSEHEAGPWSVSPIGEGPGIQPQLVWGEGAKFRLMVEFLAIDDDALVLRLEYDDECFKGAFSGTGRIEAVRRAILHAVDALVSRDAREEGSFCALRRELDVFWQGEIRSGFWTAAMAGGNDLDAVLLADRELAFQCALPQLTPP